MLELKLDYQNHHPLRGKYWSSLFGAESRTYSPIVKVIKEAKRPNY
jgi:hypothetical protein